MRKENVKVKSSQKNIIKIIRGIVIIMFLGITIYEQNHVQASEDKSLIQQQLEYYTRNIDVNNISKEDVLKVYDDISEEYTNEEVADLIKENSEEIKKQGISEEVIETGANFIRTTDPESLRDIIKNDIDVEDIKEKINQGYTPNQILTSIIQETPNQKKVEIATKLLLSNKIVKTVLAVFVIWFIYGTILRWRIYAKAGKHGWAAIIPLYRQIVMYQVCGLSPWLMLFWILPIIGWFIMGIVAIMKRFCLANEFGKGSLFGFGLLLLPPIFQSILAFNPNIEKIND